MGSIAQWGGPRRDLDAARLEGADGGRVVATGDLTPKEVVATDDEIGELAHTFEDGYTIHISYGMSPYTPTPGSTRAWRTPTACATSTAG